MPPDPPLVAARGVTVRYGAVEALTAVDLDVAAGARLGVTGCSGSGKSTLARCLAGWETPAAGEIVRRAGVQMVLQDPAASLNPRFTAVEAVAEPLRIRRACDAAARRRLALQAMEAAGLAAARGDSPTGQFSGGEKTRLALARAWLALEPGPGVLILDESLASLDDRTLDRILELLAAEQAARRLAYVVVSHDLAVLARFATDLAVLDGGRLVERGRPAELLRAPAHPATARLAEALARL